MLVGTAVDPPSHILQVVPVDIVHHLAAFGSSSIAHDLYVAAHLGNLAVDCLNDCAFPTRTLRILVGIAFGISIKGCLKGVDGFLYVLDLGLEVFFLLFGDV